MPIRVSEIPDFRPTQLSHATMDPHAAAAPAQALGALARSIASVSKPFADIALRIQNVENATTEMEIRKQWSAELSSMEKAQEETPDDPKALAKADAFLEKSLATINAPDMPPASRDRLMAEYGELYGKIRIRTAERVARRAVDRGRAAFESTFQVAVDAGDTAAQERTISTATEAGIIDNKQAAAYRVQAREETEERQAMAEIQTDAITWAAANANPDRTAPGFDGVKHANRMQLARRVISGQTLSVYHSVALHIEAGRITRPEQIDERTDRLTATANKRLKEMLAGRADAAPQTGRPAQEVQHQLAGDVGARLLSYRADGEDYDGELVEIADRIRKMEEGPLRETYEQYLQDAVSGTKRQPRTAAEWYRRAIDRAWENNHFGRQRPPVHRVDISPLLERGLLRDREKLEQVGLPEEDIRYIGGDPGTAADDQAAATRFAERYGALREKKAVADPFLQAVFTTLGEGRMMMDYTTPEEDAEAERKNVAARARYGAALTTYSSWLQRNKGADEEKTRAAAEQAATAGTRQDAAYAVLGR